MTNHHPTVISAFTEISCITTASSRIPSYSVHTGPSRQLMCAHILVRTLDWNVASAGTKAVLGETARQKKRCCSSFKTKEFSHKHRAVSSADSIQVLQYIFFLPKFNSDQA